MSESNKVNQRLYIEESETRTAMKQWLYQHPERAPMYPSHANSRTISRWLQQNGWQVIRDVPGVGGAPGEFILSPPGEIEGPLERPPDAEFGDFRLEAELRGFLAHNLHLIKIGTGPIDILITDSEAAFYVMELKRAVAPDRTVGQLLRYMGWVKLHLAKDKPVHGVIVAREINETLQYAALLVPNVSLFEYQVQFTLNRPVHQLAADPATGIP